MFKVHAFGSSGNGFGCTVNDESFPKAIASQKLSKVHTCQFSRLVISTFTRFVKLVM